MQPVAWIPSPSQSVWHLGPLPIRAYALCIVAGIVVAVVLTARRFQARGGRREEVWDVAGWAIVFGIIGGRLYHVVTDPELYFAAGRRPLDAFKIWDGGLGIWGAIALGGVGAWIGCRRKGIAMPAFADAAAPGVVLAQAIGRWGNWFNNELYGGPTRLPWGLQIRCLDITVGHAQPGGFASGGEQCPAGSAVLAAHYQPTFLYECLWDVGVALLLIYVDRRRRMGRGTVLLLYAMAYTAGRGWIEALRTDHANHFLGLRLNDWTSIVVFLVALLLFLRRGGFRSQREPDPYRKDHPRPQAQDAAQDEAPLSAHDENPEEVTADGRHDQ